MWKWPNLFGTDKYGYGEGVMVFNATFNKISVISWRSVSLVEETGVPHIWNKYCPTIWLTAWITTFSRILSLFDQLIEFLHENSHQFPFNIINELTTLNIFWHFGCSRNRFSFFYLCITIYLHSRELNFQTLAKTGTLKRENIKWRNIIVHWQQENLYL